MSGWTTKSLGEIAESVDYGVTESATHLPVGPKFLRITDIQNGTVDWNSVPWCECDARSSSESRLKAGDIVFARTGATTGKSFLIRECPVNAVFASYLIRVRFSGSVEPSYISHFFQTPIYWAQITKNARGAAQPGINATTLKSLEIPVPPLAEQRQIAELLDKAEALRADRRAALAQLDALIQSIFLDMFGDPTTNPKAWPQRTLSDACDKIIDCPHSTPKWTAQGVICLRTSNLTEGDWEWADTRYVSEGDYTARSSRGYVAEGDIVLSREGTVGIAAIVQSGMRLCMGQRLVQVRPLAASLLSEYLLRHLLYVLAPLRIGRIMVGSTSQHLNVKELRGLRIPIPSIQLQREFSRCIAVVEKLKTAHRDSLTALDSLFASVQHRAFKGEL